MTDNLVERLKAIPPYTKITFVVESMFGDTKVKVKTCGEIRQNGYITEEGGWALRKISDSDKECYEILVIPQRKRKRIWVKLGYTIKDYLLGW